MSLVAQSMECEVVKKVALRYWQHIPPGESAPEGFPLILFLHGAGERGTDLNKVKVQGVPKIVEQQPDFPFIVLAPQCPEDTTWPMQLDALQALLDTALGSLPVDASRCYLTGLSMGGFGSWALGAECPERWAAIAPICGGGRWLNGFPKRAERLVGVPIWAFHGAQDPVVPLAESQQLVEFLTARGADVRLTIYPEAGHDSWTQTYANPELYSWFLAHRISDRNPHCG